jgi:hypothetical protein
MTLYSTFAVYVQLQWPTTKQVALFQQKYLRQPHPDTKKHQQTNKTINRKHAWKQHDNQHH